MTAPTINKFINLLTKKILKTVSITLCLLIISGQTQAFSLQNVVDKAKALSEKGYSEPQSDLPDALKKLSFMDYQKINFNHDKTYWKQEKLPFRLEFYHQGMYFDKPVKINEIINDKVKEIRYSSDYFDTSAIGQAEAKASQLGFAGFKVQFPINNPQKMDDEIFSALGASYFRAIGKNQTYGLSARGLAIDTGLMTGEEFPHFTEFWIEKPKLKQKQLVIYALLDSPSVTGAYKITLQPNVDMVVDVEAKIFFRKKVEKLGIAPLTSMFLFGKNQPSDITNYRPELHDSNGLSILTADDKWIWRPLNNPEKLSFSLFTMDNPKGFGLIQRDKSFDNYQDLDDHYEKRPSAWIEPENNWGKGHVELIEIPTADETNDNIVSFWVPEKQYQAGDELAVKYKITYTLNEQNRYPNGVARVKETLYSLGDEKQVNLVRKLDGSYSYVIDFVGKNLAKLPANQSIKPAINISENGELVSSRLVYNPVYKGWRLILQFKVKSANKPTEIYVSLVTDDGKNQQLTETWNAQYPAQ
ncbi:glucans biosynthesis protein [Orbus hercynius]|uniref:Glucans biosynthesis protein G n=1 Tax=Orbus hercynius TaxID=593135 RepID=A0A495RJK4_9GAMM|nr:glucan biosynthesis protein G [Orbus hercynius]RKS87484.1 glucans biosynthesis protein [Orbus hercynius]